MRCSAIIVTYNSGRTIGACLEALAAEPCEIIVVDNASGDDTVERVEEFVAWHPARVIANAENVGFAAGVNQGAREAEGDVLLILNPDAIAEPGAVAALLRCLDETGAAAAGGALIDEQGQPARGFAFRRIATLRPLAYEALLVNQLWPGNSVNREYRCLGADYSQQQDVEQPAGACLAVTRTMWDKLGGFDEQFFPVWFEDVDFCKRLRDRRRQDRLLPASPLSPQRGPQCGTAQLPRAANLLVRQHAAVRQEALLAGGGETPAPRDCRRHAFALGGRSLRRTTAAARGNARRLLGHHCDRVEAVRFWRKSHDISHWARLP